MVKFLSVCVVPVKIDISLREKEMEQTHFGGRIRVERTLAIIKPDVYDKAEEIEGFILQSGITVLQVSKSRMHKL